MWLCVVHTPQAGLHAKRDGDVLEVKVHEIRKLLAGLKTQKAPCGALCGLSVQGAAP
jgi:hypothetical protein